MRLIPLFHCVDAVRRADLGSGTQTDHPPMFAIMVLEQTGADVVNEHVWGYGPFSHLMRKFKDVSNDLDLLDCLSTGDNKRWGAVLPHLLHHLQVLCPQTAQSSYEQV